MRVAVRLCQRSSEAELLRPSLRTPPPCARRPSRPDELRELPIEGGAHENVARAVAGHGAAVHERLAHAVEVGTTAMRLSPGNLSASVDTFELLVLRWMIFSSNALMSDSSGRHVPCGRRNRRACIGINRRRLRLVSASELAMISDVTSGKGSRTVSPGKTRRQWHVLVGLDHRTYADLTVIIY